MAKSLFNDFSVTFHGSEVELYDFDGNLYPDDIDGVILPAEKAYEFFVQLNAADKEWFDHRILGAREPQAVYFDVSIPENDPICNICFQLGKLEFRNAKSVAEALAKFLPHIYDKILQYPDEYENRTLTEEECIELKAELKLGIAALSNEETLFLSRHPDIRQINERSIHGAYLYSIPKKEFKELRNKSPRTVLHALDKPSDEALSIVLPQEIQSYSERKIQRTNYLESVVFSNIEQYPMFLLPDNDLSLFESSSDPAEISRMNAKVFENHLHIHPVISEMEIEALHLLNKELSLQEAIAPFDSREDDFEAIKWNPPQASWGLDAFERFLKYHVGILHAGTPKDAMQHPFLPAIRAFKDVTLNFHKDTIFHLQYKDLPRRVYQELGGTCVPEFPSKADQLLKRAWSVRAKYDETQSFNPWLEPLPTDKLPDCKQSRKLLEDSYEPPAVFRSLEDRTKANLFYDAYAACDPDNDTPEKLCRSALLRMAQDGLSKAMAKSVLKSGSPHPAYYLEIANELFTKDFAVQEAYQDIRLREAFAK